MEMNWDPMRAQKTEFQKAQETDQPMAPKMEHQRVKVMDLCLALH